MIATKRERQRREREDNEATRSGVYLAKTQPSSARGARATLGLLDDVMTALQSDDADEDTLLLQVVYVFRDVGIECAIDVDTDDGRVRISANNYAPRLSALVDRQVERALAEARPFCCIEVGELQALDVDWLLCTPIEDDDVLGTLTLHTSIEEKESPSVELMSTAARLIGRTLAARRKCETLRGALERREIAMSIVAHDLKNPFNVMKLAAALLRDDSLKTLPCAAMMERQASYGLALVSDILESTVMTSPNFVLHRTTCAPAALAIDALAHVAPLAMATSLRLETEVDTQVPHVFVDERRIMQVLLNLLGNAVKFTPRGGMIAIGARLHGDDVAFHVADSGPGIASHHRDHVFERFWHADAMGSGTGLGLAIARTIVEAHGGKIWVDPAPRSGAKVMFTIPNALTAPRPQ